MAIIASNSLKPPGHGSFDQAAWVEGAFDALANGVVQAAMANQGDTSKVGMPASWPYGPIPTGAVRADGTISPLLASQIEGYVNSPQAQMDSDFGSWLGVQYSAAAPGGLQEKPLTIQEQLALRAADLNEAKFYMSAATSGGARTSSSSSGSTRSTSSRSSGGSSGGSSTDYGARLGYESASNDLDAQLAREKFELQKELMLLQFQLDNDPNNPELLLKQKSLDENVRQFNATLAAQTERDNKAIGLERAKTVADYSANPGDMVARDYFLRGQASPQGTPIDIFTGQVAGGPMTFSEMMQYNAPAVGGPMQGAAAPPPEIVPPVAAPVEPPIAPPPVDEQPVFAYGTDPQLTRDGWTRADQFIAGDPQIPGVENPEQIKLRVRNGEAEAKVTPLSQMLRGPKFATGTNPWDALAYQAPDFDTGYENIYTGETYDPTPTYTAPTTTAPTYSSTTQTSQAGQTDANNDGLDDRTSAAMGVIAGDNGTYWYDGQQVNLDGSLYTAPAAAPTATSSPTTAPPATATAAAPAIDPYAGTPFAGMQATDTVTNQNSWQYGMAVEDAMQALMYSNAAPPVTAVGPTVQQFDRYGRPVPYPDGTAFVTDNAESGILTGAQLSNGETQSVRPDLPGYVSPEGWPAPPGGTVSTGVEPAPDGSYFGTVPLQPGLNSITTTVPTDYTALANPANVQIYDPATGQYRPLAQGESIPAGTQVGVFNPAQTPTPTIGGATPIGTGGVTLEPANLQGFARAATGGTYTENGATYTIMAGDYRAPDGQWLSYNTIMGDYLPIQPALTPISSREEFWALPPEIQQQIFTGQPTGYALVQGPGADQWREGLLAGANSFSNQVLSPEQFLALPPEQQKALLEGEQSHYRSSGATGVYQYAPTNDLGPTMGSLSGLLRTGQGGGAQAFDYSQYMTDADWDRLYPEYQQWQDQAYSEAALRDFYAGVAAQVPEGYGPGATPPATTIPAGYGPGATPPATTPPAGYPPSGTPPATTPAAGTPPAGTPPATGTPGLAELLALIYGPDAYQNMPSLQYLMGNMSGGDYGNLTNEEVQVPGLGITLPSPSQASNYGMLQDIIAGGGFEALNSLYTAGGVPLSLILEMSKARAPLGTAFESSLIV